MDPTKPVLPTTPTAAPTRETFDQQIIATLTGTLQALCLKHPEIRSLSVAIDWQEPLNDSKLPHGLWMGADGPVLLPAAIIGSGFQVLRMFDTIAGRMMDWLSQMRTEATRLSAERLARAKEDSIVPTPPGDAQ